MIKTQIIEKIIENYNYSHKFLMENLETYKYFSDIIVKKAYKEGNLKSKYKHLIGLGISIVLNCQSCVFIHMKDALESGCTYKQVLEVFEITVEMGGGPAFVRNQYNLRILNALKKSCYAEK
ncbi:MAG: carboxymuconolactone decarboxylase family protein [Promethearchaeota archaeon]